LTPGLPEVCPKNIEEQEMKRKEYRFVVEGEPYDAPLESLKELFRAGVIREDQLVEVEGVKQTLGEVLGEVSVAAGIETEQVVIAPVTPSRTATTAARQGVVFRPFVVCGLVLLILFTSWCFFDPAAGSVNSRSGCEITNGNAKRQKWLRKSEGYGVTHCAARSALQGGALTPLSPKLIFHLRDALEILPGDFKQR
jgi:hypothetical protein